MASIVYVFIFLSILSWKRKAKANLAVDSLDSVREVMWQKLVQLDQETGSIACKFRIYISAQISRYNSLRIWSWFRLNADGVDEACKSNEIEGQPAI